MDSMQDLPPAPQNLPACAFAAPLAAEPDMPVLLSLAAGLLATLLMGLGGSLVGG